MFPHYQKSNKELRRAQAHPNPLNFVDLEATATLEVEGSSRTSKGAGSNGDTGSPFIRSVEFSSNLVDLEATTPLEADGAVRTNGGVESSGDTGGPVHQKL